MPRSSGLSAYEDQLVARATSHGAKATGDAVGGATAAPGQNLTTVASVEIAPGKWKYVQIELRDGEATKRIVRSFAGRKFHADMFEKAMQDLEPLGLQGVVIGGGSSNFYWT